MWSSNENRILLITVAISILFDILFMLMVSVQAYYVALTLALKAFILYLLLTKKYKDIHYFISMAAIVLSALASAKAVFIEDNNVDYILAYCLSNTAVCLVITILVGIKFIRLHKK